MSEARAGRATRLEWRGRVALISIDRDEVLNALDESARRELAATLRQVAGSAAVDAIVLMGRGERAFCVGQDLREADRLEAQGPRWMASWNDLYDVISTLPHPSIALLNGVAVGAGLQLALLCDVRLASTTARLGLREVEVGLPAITGFWLLHSMIGRSRATELILTGRLVDSQEALALGLVGEVVAPEVLVERGVALARQLAERPRGALATTRRHLQELLLPGFEDATAAAARDQAAAIATGTPQALMARFMTRPRQHSQAGGTADPPGG